MSDTSEVEMSPPVVADGSALWRMARDSATLDVNSPYAYLLWCRDFAATSVIARVDGREAGFVTGYLRTDQPSTLMVWQVAVDAAHRGQGIGARLLDHLVTRLLTRGVTHLETSITADNDASHRLFGSFARRWGAELHRSELFAAELFPDGPGGGHLAEELFRIGPLRVARSVGRGGVVG